MREYPWRADFDPVKLFAPLYEKAIAWARHPRAPAYLAGLSFVEAFIFPVAPEIMLAPMALARPRDAYRFAAISLFFSLAGALVGYALGHYAYQWLMPWLARIDLLEPIEQWVGKLRAEMNGHYFGMLVFLFLAALQPLVPVKIITWASGVVGVPVLPFVACVALGRGKRVFLLAWLVRLAGPRAEAMMRRSVEWIGWVTVGLVVSVLVIWKLA